MDVNTIRATSIVAPLTSDKAQKESKKDDAKAEETQEGSKVRIPEHGTGLMLDQEA